MNRHYAAKEARESNYDKYTINAGSVLHCPNCPSTKITIENKNKRSADEPTETYYKCQDCGKEFYERIKIK